MSEIERTAAERKKISEAMSLLARGCSERKRRALAKNARKAIKARWRGHVKKPRQKAVKARETAA